MQARDGSAQLTKGLTEAKSGSSQLAAGAKTASSSTHQLATGASELSSGMGQLQTGSGKLTDGLGELSSGSLDLYDGATQVAGGTQTLASTVVPVLDRAAQVQGQVKSDSAAINADVQSLTGQVSGTTSSVDSRLADVAVALDRLSNVPGVSDSQAYRDAQARLDQAQQRNQAVAQAADRVSNRSATLNQRVQDSASGSDLAQASKQLTRLNDGAQQVAGGAKRLNAGINSAQAGSAELETGIAKAAGGAQQLSTGAAQLDTGIATLSTNTTKLDAGLGKLVTGSQQLTKGLTDVNALVENPAKVYGRGLAPLFFSIAMWVFGISGFLVMRPISGRLLAGRMNPLRLTLSAFIPFGTVAVVGAGLMLATVWMTLGLDPVHGLAAVGLTLLVALVFAMIAHLLRMSLGLPGSAILLVWLILQLSSTGGTYPAAVLPPFFQWVNPFMPITYSIDAFRVVISGGLWSHFWRDVAVLVCLGLGALALDVLAVGRRQRFTMSDLHPPLQH